MARGPHEIRFGNPFVHEPVVEKGVVRAAVPRPELGKQVTSIGLPHADAAPLIAAAAKLEKALEEYGRHGLLYVHLLTADSLEPWEIAFKHLLTVVSTHAHAGMDWVECEDAKLRAVLARFLEADEGEVSGYGQELPILAGGSPEWDDILRDLRELAAIERARWPEVYAELVGELTALKTTVGFEAIAKSIFGNSAQPAQFKYMAISNNASAPAEGDSTLTGENTTASGGLLRREITYGYTSGTKKATSQATFTANSNDVSSLPYTVHKFALFNKVTSGGEMCIETEITAATLSAENDNVTITDTITLA